MWPHVTMRIYIALLCAVYFSMLYVFHGRLQHEVNELRTDGASQLPQPQNYNSPKTKLNHKPKLSRRVLKTEKLEGANPRPAAAFVGNDKVYNDWRRGDDGNSIVRGREKIGNKDPPGVDKSLEYYHHNNGPVITPKTTYTYSNNCFTHANYSKQRFIALESQTFLYSAYLDERNDRRVIRIMTILSLEKKNRVLEVFCHFQVDGSHIIKKASFYELCENHGKRYGGFMLSCDVPPELNSVCSISVSMNIIPVHYKYIPPSTSIVNVPVIRLVSKHVPYNYSICVPPLFGKINSLHFVEFIELNLLMGVEHFIFYNYSITNSDINKLLDYYKSQNLVTLIDWMLPNTIAKSSIWYNGQLSAHNDCLYRGMSLTKYLAIIDIDEYIIPHNEQLTFDKSFSNLFRPDVAGLSFQSAFYDQKFSTHKERKKSKLITLDTTGRSAVFSKVRTKVMVQPALVFEVGIHHVSKPVSDVYRMAKVNTSVAYLHHYRLCIPNFGMKCSRAEEDSMTMAKYEVQLKTAVRTTFQKALHTDIVL